MKRFFIAVFLWCFTNLLSAQQVFLNGSQELVAVSEKPLYSKKSNFHTSVRPFYYKEIQSVYNRDSIVELMMKENRLFLTSDKWWAQLLRWGENKLLDEHLIDRKLGVLKLRADPAINLSIGRDRIADDATWLNTRGFTLEGEIGEKFQFNSAFFESQGLFLPYMQTYMNQAFVVPGQGRSKPFKGGPAVDFAYARGVVVYKANETFTFQFGHDKNFIGDGYRSLLLSDNATNYPFLKIETNFWNIKYVNLYMQLNHLGFDYSGDRLFDRKYISAQYLSWNATKWFNFSLFEMVEWRALPTRDFDFNYLNPIIFLRPVEYQNGSEDKVMIGATTKIKILDKLSLYGQLVVDDLKISEFKNKTYWWGNKYGIQAGLKAFDVFTIKGLSFQAEYNTVRPYTYSHSDSINAYANLNQPLAHPLGANFNEGVAFIRYNYKRHFIQLRGSQAVFGLDTANINHGQNIFYSYNTNKVEIEGEDGLYGHRTLQGLKTTLTILEAKYSYLVNPSTNLMVEIGITDRVFLNDQVENKTRLLFIGLKTNISNYYYDFL